MTGSLISCDISPFHATIEDVWTSLLSNTGAKWQFLAVNSLLQLNETTYQVPGDGEASLGNNMPASLEIVSEKRK